VVLVLVAGVMAVVQLGRASTTAQSSTFLPPVMPSIFHGGTESAAIWTAVALLVTLASVKLSMRLGSGRV